MTRYRRPPGPTPEETHDRYLRRQERAGRLAVHVAYAARIRPWQSATWTADTSERGRAFAAMAMAVVYAARRPVRPVPFPPARAVELAEELEGR